MANTRPSPLALLVKMPPGDLLGPLGFWWLQLEPPRKSQLSSPELGKLLLVRNLGGPRPLRWVSPTALHSPQILPSSLNSRGRQEVPGLKLLLPWQPVFWVL